MIIPYGKQYIDKDDINEVVSVLQSDFLTQGPAIEHFERAICDYVGSKFCIAVSNATAALHIAVKALNISKDSEGITSPNTFVASSNCMVYNSIFPRFADIDSNSYNISPSEIRAKITEKTKLLIPVHFAGRACDMKTIKAIADEHSLYVIEDAAHAIGSHYEDGSKVGNCKYSDMTVFSFHPVKTITTGEGGVITTNNEKLYKKLLLLRSHGITRDEKLLKENHGAWYYEMQDIGFNYRMTDIQAALGKSQLAKLENFKDRRNEIIKRYNSELKEISWLQTPLDDTTNSCFHLYVVKIDFEKLKLSKEEVVLNLRDKGVGTQVHYIPVHTQPYYKETYGYKWGDYPVSENYYNSALTLPLYPTMTDEQVSHAINTIKELG